ncbi:hypothetical protein P3L10_004658 [Capsicum annuum]
MLLAATSSRCSTDEDSPKTDTKRRNSSMTFGGDGDWPRPDKSSKSTAKKKSRTPVDSNEKTLGLFKCFGSCWIN